MKIQCLNIEKYKHFILTLNLTFVPVYFSIKINFNNFLQKYILTKKLMPFR